jgi:hypothetical protein
MYAFEPHTQSYSISSEEKSIDSPKLQASQMLLGVNLPNTLNSIPGGVMIATEEYTV